jgi:hypothetical protein
MKHEEHEGKKIFPNFVSCVCFMVNSSLAKASLIDTPRFFTLSCGFD